MKYQNRPENEREIRYISKLIRARYSKKSKHINLTDNNHDTEIKENFWKYCKENLEQKKNDQKPDFDEQKCFEYFKNSFNKSKKSDNTFPSWFRNLNEPTEEFNLEPPSYQEVTKIIKKMKSSGSPCPYDQVSIIVLKKCPILRTALHRIIKYCWKNDTFPTEWKYAFTVLIYKRESNKEPSNFRPITLQPVLAKVYSSVIRNRMYTFLIKTSF